MPRENRPDAIEVYNTTDGRGNHHVNIHIPVEAAEEIATCLHDPNATNPSLANLILECAQFTFDDRNYQAFLEKGKSNGK